MNSDIPILNFLQDIERQRHRGGDARLRRTVGNMDGSTRLHQACKRGDVSLATQLIEEGEDINKKDHAGFTPFMDSINQGNVFVIAFSYLVLIERLGFTSMELSVILKMTTLNLMP